MAKAAKPPSPWVIPNPKARPSGRLGIEDGRLEMEDRGKHSREARASNLITRPRNIPQRIRVASRSEELANIVTRGI